jgi:hypothetical protein
MSLFHRALRRVVAAVYQLFDSDERLQAWLVGISTGEGAEREQMDSQLERLLDALETGWVSAMLMNEDRTEEVGVLGEAIAAVLHEPDASTTTRSIFAYRLASWIVNKGIRPLNRTVRRLEYQTPSQMNFQASPTTSSMAEAGLRTQYRKHVLALLGSETRSNEVATAKITMDVAEAWPDAIGDVQSEAGNSQARPMSAAVKAKVAGCLDLPVSTVEAAMKRYKRAIQRVRARTEPF